MAGRGSGRKRSGAVPAPLRFPAPRGQNQTLIGPNAMGNVPASSAPQLTGLPAPADRFKGGRDYVHGTDILAGLEALAGRGGHVARIEFARPLRTLGCVGLGVPSARIRKDGASALGALEGKDAGTTPFVIFPSPIAITAPQGIFDEAALLAACERVDQDRIQLAACGGAGFFEQVSSAMKALCQLTIPQAQRWWFARLSAQAGAPENHDGLELTTARVIAGRLVSADIKVDGSHWGRIDFARAPS